MKILHNPRCRKSREGLEYLKSKTSDLWQLIKIVAYVDMPVIPPFGTKKPDGRRAKHAYHQARLILGRFRSIQWEAQEAVVTCIGYPYRSGLWIDCHPGG